MNKLLLLTLCMMLGCAEVVIDTSSKGKGGGSGGEGGETISTSSEGGSSGSSSSSGSGGSGGETTSSTTTETETMTTTETCDPGPKDCQAGTCFCPADHACCDKAENPEMCTGNESGYCCSIDMFCLPIN